MSITKTELNQNEFRVVGISRSGNHAIINWILSQIKGTYCFLNCAEPKYNPFESARPLSLGGKTYETNMASFDLESEKRGDFLNKDFLLYSYEDCFLGSLDHKMFKDHREEWVGKSTLKKNIIILRDPINLFASRLKANLLQGHYSHGAKPITLLTLKRIYKQHANQFLGRKTYLKNSVGINFNSWTMDKNYRKSITDELGIPFTDDGFDEVSGVVGGSSFDGMKFSGNANEMKLHNRWEEYKEDEKFIDLFDLELLDLAEEIFGTTPAVAFFRSKIE